MLDFLDPNNWTEDTHEYRVYLDPRDESLYAVVDAEDYQWAIQWRWKWKRSKRSSLIYAKRTTRTVHGGPSFDLYLHIEIMKRVDPEPVADHILVDHRNGKSLDCRRSNLRWATVEMNTANRAGSAIREEHV